MTKVFDKYSKYYNLLYQDKDYAKEADYISSLIKTFSPGTKNILELGCGTGKHASLLNKNGYDILGIDLSNTMLERAKEIGVNCAVGDVRNFRADRKFDSIISLFHILSYQTTDEDVLNFFETAAFHLDSNGIIVFDVWYKPAVLAQVPEKRVKELENDEIKVIRYCTPNLIAEKSVVEVNYTIEITDKATNEKEVLKEVHPMRYFSSEEIKNFAEEKGFKIILEEEWLTKNKPSENTWGVCFVGFKE